MINSIIINDLCTDSESTLLINKDFTSVYVKLGFIDNKYLREIIIN